MKTKIKPTKIRLTSYTGNKVPITGKVNITVERKVKSHKLRFIVTLGNVRAILGKDMLNLIKQVNIIQKLEKSDILAAYKEFAGKFHSQCKWKLM